VPRGTGRRTACGATDMRPIIVRPSGGQGSPRGERVGWPASARTERCHLNFRRRRRPQSPACSQPRRQQHGHARWSNTTGRVPLASYSTWATGSAGVCGRLSSPTPSPLLLPPSSPPPPPPPPPPLPPPPHPPFPPPPPPPPPPLPPSAAELARLIDGLNDRLLRRVVLPSTAPDGAADTRCGLNAHDAGRIGLAPSRPGVCSPIPAQSSETVMSLSKAWSSGGPAGRPAGCCRDGGRACRVRRALAWPDHWPLFADAICVE
jgi:hypothetical protein